MSMARKFISLHLITSAFDDSKQCLRIAYDKKDEELEAAPVKFTLICAE